MVARAVHPHGGGDTGQTPARRWPRMSFRCGLRPRACAARRSQCLSSRPSLLPGANVPFDRLFTVCFRISQPSSSLMFTGQTQSYGATVPAGVAATPAIGSTFHFLLAASTVARMPARTASGSIGQASMARCRSRPNFAGMGVSARDRARPLSPCPRKCLPELPVTSRITASPTRPAIEAGRAGVGGGERQTVRIRRALYEA